MKNDTGETFTESDFISGDGNFIGLAAPSSVTSNVVYKLPSEDGMIGNVLATDGSGNTASCMQTVTVIDNIDPTISCPATVNVNVDAGLCTASSVTLGTPTTSDNCAVASVTNDAPGVFPIGDTTVT